MGDVVEVKFKKEVGYENEMVDAVKATVYSFSGRMSVAAALGVLSIVEHELKQELLDE